jgi:hypothetical protein
VTLCFNSLPLNKKKEIISSISSQEFKEATHDIRGLGKTKVFQWRISHDEPAAVEPVGTAKP